MKKVIVNGLKTIWTPLNSQRLWQQAKCPPGFKPDGVPVLRSGSRHGAHQGAICNWHLPVKEMLGFSNGSH